jgi:hypothetical protein
LGNNDKGDTKDQKGPSCGMWRVLCADKMTVWTLKQTLQLRSFTCKYTPT